MRFMYLIALVAFATHPTVSTLAQEPTADQRLSPPGNLLQAGLLPPTLGVFGESSLVRFRLHSGRILLDPVRYRKGTQESSSGDLEESLTLSCTSGIPSIYYTCKTKTQTIQMSAEHGRTLRIESLLTATGETAVLEQRKGKPIRWSTRRSTDTDDNLSCDVSGATLMHVIGMDESGIRVHLDSLFTRMLRGQSVVSLSRETQDYLCRHVARLPRISRSEIDELIDLLRHPKIARRREATRQLTQLGSVAAPLLEAALIRDDLDAEQRSRIGDILRYADRYDQDTPASLAHMLSTDREHWSIIAARLTQHDRVAVNEHIRSCGLGTLDR